MPTRRSEQLLLQPGSVLAGRYRIDRVLGRGGFAQVYLGRHVEVDSLQVAIKVLHAAHQDREAIVSRFRREARLLALLRNRHTVRLIDFGFSDEGMGYLVMEYVRGAALDRLIREQAPMRATDVARVGIGVLKALDEAHSIGVIHRDLKPANVLLINEPGERHAVPRVLDFGIAKVLGVADAVVSPDGDEVVARTRADMVFCTPLYASPELLRGKPDFRTDLYALGLVMAEMLDGSTPYTAEACALADSPHLSREPVPLGDRTRQSGLGDVIARACAKRLSERYASAVEMLADLEIAYDSIREPDYRESPLRIVPSPPPAATKAPAPDDARSSRFVPVSSLGAEDDFESIVGFDSNSTHVVPPARMASRASAVDRAAPSPHVMVDPILAVPEGPGGEGATDVARSRRRLGPGAIAALVVLLFGVANAVVWMRHQRQDTTGAPAAVPAVAEAPPPPDRGTPPTFASRTARRALHTAITEAEASVLYVTSDLPATVRVDGIPVGEVGPDAALAMRGPTRRPYALELVAPGVVFSRMINEDGAVAIDATMAALRDDPQAIAPPEPTRRPRRPREPGADRPESTTNAPPGVAEEPPGSLGDPIRPRTQ